MQSLPETLVPNFNDSDINTLIMCFSGIRQELKTITEKIDNMDGKIDNLQDDLKQNEIAYAKLEGKVDSLDREIDEIKDNDLKKLEQEIKTFKEDLKDCKDDDRDTLKTYLGWILSGIILIITVIIGFVKFR